MTAITTLPVTTSEQIECVAKLARIIWSQHYLSIIGQAQIDYMLARFQSPQAIAAQLVSGDEYFLLLPTAASGMELAAAIGYAAIRAQPETQRLFVSKVYLLESCRGQGYGRATLEQIAHWARARRLSTVWLTVNKYNPALQVYLKLGFINTGDVVTDIGEGYVMDDYQLEWQVA